MHSNPKHTLTIHTSDVVIGSSFRLISSAFFIFLNSMNAVGKPIMYIITTGAPVKRTTWYDNVKPENSETVNL